MIKRLMLSLLTIGVVAGALTYGVFAYFLDSSSTAVTVSAGGPVDLRFDVDANCDSTNELTDQDNIPATTTASDMIPGDEQSACLTVHNASTTDLDVYARNDTFNQSVSGFLDVLYGRVENLSDATTPCAYNRVASAQYTSANSGRGCFLFNLAPGGAKTIRVGLKFVNNNTDQSALVGAIATWNSVVSGYTTP